MRARLHAAGLTTNDYVFGMNDSGRMTAPRVQAFLANLPRGTSELYVHPATGLWPEAFPPDYDFEGEFEALIDPSVVSAVRNSQIRPITFTELATA